MSKLCKSNKWKFSNGVMIKKSICCILLVSLMAGCGYTTGSLLPSHLKTIHVENFVNKIDISREQSDTESYEIYRPGLETDITKAIIDEFMFDGNLSIVGEKEADLILKGELINYTQEPLRYDEFDNVEEYRVLITVNMELEDTAAGEPMWEEKGFVGEVTYDLIGATAKSEETARSDAVEDLAERVVERTTEGW